MFSLYDLGASLSLSPVPGDALLAEELPKEAEPEDAVPEVAALEAVAPGVAVLAPVVPPVCAEVALAGRGALTLLALFVSDTSFFTSQWNGSKLELGSTQDGFLEA